MNRKEFLECVRLARSENFDPIPYLELRAFDGCSLDTKRRAVTIKEVASLLIGHCATLGGTWLHDEQNKIESLSKRFDLID